LAIAAPTPVSALVHSSTLVTAGIFLLIRFNNSVVINYFFLIVLGLFTLCMAGVIANFEWDIKKLIAFSTLRQLRFIVLSLSRGLLLLCFFHLICHALFKAALFITSGVIIHSTDRSQDFRNSSLFVRITPLLGARSIICILCLAGFPFLSGFFSKDFILDRFSFFFFFFFFFLISVLLTISYSLRFSFYIIIYLLTVRKKIVLFYDILYYIILPV
jgi:NADH-ubiquinone oxidoreductase chain 5